MAVCAYSAGIDMTQETLKLALEALELVNIEFVCNGAHHAKKDRHSLDEDCPVTVRYQQAIAAIKEALAQPEQEPVAYVIWGIGNVPNLTFDLPEDGDVYDAVYYAPPQRTWVGLASEDRLTAKYMQDAPDGIEAVIDYIEAKLKEKNCAG